MVLYVMKYDILADKADAYTEWVGSAIQRLLAAPGLVALRGYRPLTGSHQVVSTYEFANAADWVAWRTDEDVQRVMDEARAFCGNLSAELWGPSPVAPEPLRPQR
jgi:heme-degrading monooxygenase HmoA